MSRVERLSVGAAALAVAAYAGCGARSEMRVGQSEPGAAAGSTSSGGAGGTITGGLGGTGGATVDASIDVPADVTPPDPWWNEVAGHWMRLQIGDCIFAEDWFTLAPPSGFVHTLVNRDYCGPHFVLASPGTLETAGRTLDVRWAQPDWGADAALGEQRRRFTVAVVPGYVSPVTPLPDPSYVVGSRALNLAAYYQAPGDAQHRRLDGYETKDSSGAKYATSLAIDLHVSPLPPHPNAAVPCKLSFTIAATLETVSSKLSGKESFEMTCTILPDGPNGWAYVLADGFGKDLTGVAYAWQQYLEKQGIYSKYGGAIGDLMSQGFRPVLFYLPGEPSSLFQDIGDRWLVEMLTPPPTSVP